MKGEFNLSDYRLLWNEVMGYYYSEEDVKEFIKRLKCKIGERQYIMGKNVFEIIDKLAGEKLK